MARNVLFISARAVFFNTPMGRAFMTAPQESGGYSQSERPAKKLVDEFFADFAKALQC
jgi:hypothetical protein